MLNKEKQKEYDNIKNLVFSPDSKKLIYRARRGSKWFVVIDQIEDEKFDEIERDSLLFAPDSKNLAYQSKQIDQWFFILTDWPEKKCIRRIRLHKS